MLRKGTYILILKAGEPVEIQVGRLGKFRLESGYYAYIGSGLNSLDGRLRRYFGAAPSKKHWHIDYLLAEIRPVAAFCHISEERTECRVAELLADKYPVAIAGFGSSDCRCTGHLFYLGRNLPKLFRGRKFRLRELAFSPIHRTPGCRQGASE